MRKTCHELAVVFDFRRCAVGFPIFLYGADAVRADGYDLFDVVLREGFEISFRELLKDEVVAETANGIAGAFFFFQHAVACAQVIHHASKGGDDLASLGIVAAHTTKPEAILLCAVEDGKLFLLDELVAFERRDAESIGAALQLVKQLAAVVVLPRAGVHSAAAQADDDGQMFNADRTLELACAAGGALEDGFLRVVFAEKRFLCRWADVVEIRAQAENNFFWIKDLSRVIGRAVFGA